MLKGQRKIDLKYEVMNLKRADGYLAKHVTDGKRPAVDIMLRIEKGTIICHI